MSQQGSVQLRLRTLEGILRGVNRWHCTAALPRLHEGMAATEDCTLGGDFPQLALPRTVSVSGRCPRLNACEMAYEIRAAQGEHERVRMTICGKMATSTEFNGPVWVATA